MKSGYIYILANHHRTIYIGVTNDLEARLWQHRHGEEKSFAKKYHLTKLVYCEDFQDIKAAIAREKQLKAWRREKKTTLIEGVNPQWLDLRPE